jgi:hypothetical protein
VIDWKKFENVSREFDEDVAQDRIVNLLLKNSYAEFSSIHPKADVGQWGVSIEQSVRIALKEWYGDWVDGIEFHGVFLKSFSNNTAGTIADEIRRRLVIEKKFLEKFNAVLQILRQGDGERANAVLAFSEVLNLMIQKTEVESGWESTFQSMFEEMFAFFGFETSASSAFGSELIRFCDKIEDYRRPTPEQVQSMTEPMADVFINARRKHRQK